MANAAVIRGPVADWCALRANPDYKADWRARGGAPQAVATIARRLDSLGAITRGQRDCQWLQHRAAVAVQAAV